MNSTHLARDHSCFLGAHSLDELKQVHHSLCLHPLHLSMCGNECSSTTDSITAHCIIASYFICYETNYLYSLAHDSNGLVSRAHLHLLHQVSHLQYPSGRLRDTILWPLHVLELSDAETAGTGRLCHDLHLPDDIVVTHFVFVEGDDVLAISFATATTHWPVLMTHLLQSIEDAAA